MQKFIILAPLIFAGCCARNIQSPNNPATAPNAASVAVRTICDPIYGRATDWDVISDDLARNIYRHNRMCEEAVSRKS